MSHKKAYFKQIPITMRCQFVTVISFLQVISSAKTGGTERQSWGQAEVFLAKYQPFSSLAEIPMFLYKILRTGKINTLKLKRKNGRIQNNYQWNNFTATIYSSFILPSASFRQVFRNSWRASELHCLFLTCTWLDLSTWQHTKTHLSLLQQAIRIVFVP